MTRKIEGVSAVENRRADTSLTSRYDEFLFAPVCEEANGMRLSVLSALTRMNLDPWNEASLLAAMPSAMAERTLVSTLGLAAGGSRDPLEAESIAARLIRLLPQPQRRGATTGTTGTAGIGRQRVSHSMMLLAVAIALAISLPSPQTGAKTDPSASPSTTGETSQTTSDGLTGTFPRSELHLR